MTTTPVPDLSGRRPPGLGGFNLTALNLEIRRLRRNPRAVIITVIVPVIFFFAFGLNKTNTTGNYGHGNYAAFVLVSLALYGAIFSTTYTGAGVSVERAQGWSRQLRLTPLSPAAYIGMKVATALVLGLVPITVVNVVGGILRLHRRKLQVGNIFREQAKGRSGQVVGEAAGLLSGGRDAGHFDLESLILPPETNRGFSAFPSRDGAGNIAQTSSVVRIGVEGPPVFD